jgi:aspartate aminotransferase
MYNKSMRTPDMTDKKFSERASNFPDNPIRGLECLASEAKNKGIKIIPLNIGAPDTASPPNLLESLKTYIAASNHIEYGPTAGLNSLREARSKFYINNLDLPIEPEEILITAGASEALELAVYSVTDQGDEIVTPEPFFPNYLSVCYKYGVLLKAFPTRMEDGFHIIYKGESSKAAFDRITSSIGKKTKAIMWSSPSNPTGAIYSTEELELLYQVAKTNNLFLISDEVYRLLAFDKVIITKRGFTRAPSIYDVVPNSERWRVIGLDSSSKEVSLCGGRIGYLTIDKSFAPIITKNASVRACPSILGQKTVEKIDQVDSAYFSKNQQELKNRRNVVYDKLLKMQDVGIIVSPTPPEGAFYISFDLGTHVSAEDFCRWMLTDFPHMTEDKTTVFLTPMRSGRGGFYLGDEIKGQSEVRIAYVREESNRKSVV